MKITGPYQTYPETELISLLNEGDHQAFTEIYSRYVELLYRHAHKVLNDTDACNDVVQDVFLMIWARHKTIRILGSLSAYLYKAVKNRVLDYISHQQVAEKYADSIRNFVNQGLWIADDQLREKELLSIIEAEKTKLPPRTRQLYELNREQDLSYKEIAKQLNISEKTVKKQVHNALRTIRLKIGSLLSLLLVL